MDISILPITVSTAAVAFTVILIRLLEKDPDAPLSDEPRFFAGSRPAIESLHDIEQPATSRPKSWQRVVGENDMMFAGSDNYNTTPPIPKALNSKQKNDKIYILSGISRDANEAIRGLCRGDTEQYDRNCDAVIEATKQLEATRA